MIISRSVLIRMGNVSDKSRENQSSFVLNNFFPENRAVCEIMWKKHGRAGQTADDNTAHAHCVLDT